MGSRGELPGRLWWATQRLPGASQASQASRAGQADPAAGQASLAGGAKPAGWLARPARLGRRWPTRPAGMAGPASWPARQADQPAAGRPSRTLARGKPVWKVNEWEEHFLDEVTRQFNGRPSRGTPWATLQRAAPPANPAAQQTWADGLNEVKFQNFQQTDNFINRFTFYKTSHQIRH